MEYDKYDETIAEWYEKVVEAGYHTQQTYINDLISIIPKRSSILEIGCGTGLISIPLARAGMQIEGLDKSQEMLKKLSTKTPHIEIYNVDIRNFTPSKHYDYILSCNGIFQIKGRELDSYLLEEEEVIGCLQRYSAMSKNGILINKGEEKNDVALALKEKEFRHWELRNKDFVISIHALYGDSLEGVKKHIKRRYPLERIVSQVKQTRDFERFILFK